MSEWQTIKTAPKDEPIHLLYRAMTIGKTAKGSPYYVWAGRKTVLKGRTVWVSLDDDGTTVGEPLAWAEWPTPPTLPLHGEDDAEERR